MIARCMHAVNTVYECCIHINMHAVCTLYIKNALYLPSSPSLGSGPLWGCVFSASSYLFFLFCSCSILSLLASVWSVRVTIVGSRTLHEIRFRHDLDLELSDIALVFNTSERNGHYSGLIRRNQEVCATRRLTFSKKWDKEKDAAERLSLFQDCALEVI